VALRSLTRSVRGPGFTPSYQEPIVVIGPKDEAALREERERKEQEGREREQREARERAQREAGTTRLLWWTVRSVEDAHTFVARGPSIGTCGKRFEVQPRVRELPGRAVLRLYLHTTPEEPSGPCRKRRLSIGARIRLRQPLAGVGLYDGSKSPPVRRALPWERR
jgi:hypothetical protein